MDISEKYFKMCDHWAIQAEWKPRVGDWYTWVDDSCSLDDIAYGSYAEVRLEVIGKDEQENLASGYIKKIGTWIPRQDQIQEMVESESGLWIHIANRFYKYYTQEVLDDHGWCIETFDTLEKAWLAYFMKGRAMFWIKDKWLVE